MIHKIKKTQNEKPTKGIKDEIQETSGPWKHAAVRVTAASGLALIAASLVGVGEAAIAGAAGYFAFRRMTGKPESEPVSTASKDRSKIKSLESRKRKRAA